MTPTGSNGLMSSLRPNRLEFTVCLWETGVAVTGGTSRVAISHAKVRRIRQFIRCVGQASCRLRARYAFVEDHARGHSRWGAVCAFRSAEECNGACRAPPQCWKLSSKNGITLLTISHLEPHHKLKNMPIATQS